MFGTTRVFIQRFFFAAGTTGTVEPTEIEKWTLSDESGGRGGSRETSKVFRLSETLSAILKIEMKYWTGRMMTGKGGISGGVSELGEIDARFSRIFRARSLSCDGKRFARDDEVVGERGIIYKASSGVK